MTTDTNLSQIVFNRLSNEKYHELKTSGQLNDQQFYITPDLDTNPGLIQDYMSNCITKIPQHINLELSTDGTLTLKAGSKVYIPNGANKFENVVVKSDINFTYTYAPSTNTQCMLFINNTGTGFAHSRVVANCFSGTTQPSGNYKNWYNTTENKMYSIGNNATIDGSGFSFPIAIITQGSDGATKSIDQVFNGIGYIGAVAFAVPGVQAIIPNGFNNNSQLNNYTATVERVLLKDYAADGLLGHSLALTLTNSPLLSAGNMIYVEEENQMYKDSISELSKRTEVEIAKVTTDSTRITSLTPLPIYNRILNSTQVYDFGNDLLEKNITNCITKIPQDIKLELNAGTLTLKAGSKVYIPNGFEADGVTPKFDVIVTTQDATGLEWFSTSSPKNQMVFVRKDGLVIDSTTFISSGTSYPSSHSNGNRCYRTDLNLLYTFRTSNNQWNLEDCLPIAIVQPSSTEAGKTSSIDQVFNGFGYIGSTTFALPGVEGLIPNGKNADGSLNNTKFKTMRVLTSTKDSSWTQTQVQLINENILDGYADYDIYYDSESNYNVATNNPKVSRCIFGTANLVNGRITSFIPKSVFQAVDRNELDTYDYVVEQGVTNGITWEKWRSGKLIQSGSMNVTITSRITNVPVITFPKPMSDTNYKVFTGTTYNSGISNVSYNITSGLQTSGLNGNGHSGNICAVDNTAMSSGTVKIWWRVEGQGA